MGKYALQMALAKPKMRKVHPTNPIPTKLKPSSTIKGGGPLLLSQPQAGRRLGLSAMDMYL
jgi:hypothetical protein